MEGLNYSGCPDYDKAVTEFEGFVDLSKDSYLRFTIYLKTLALRLTQSTHTDSVIITARGAILCNMTREQRRYEPAAMKDFMPELGIPVLGAISDQGRLECGDVVWIDERTLAVGRGRRTNNEGIRQLRQLVQDFVDELIVVDLPPAVFHLMGIISLIDEKLAVINSMMLPESFRRWLVGEVSNF